MLYFYFFLFCLLAITNSRIKKPEEHFVDDYILCRWCGSDLTSADNLVRISSPHANYQGNASLYGRDNILIQNLQNQFGIPFNIVTVERAACNEHSSHKWVVKDTWFPGYYWKPCTCSHCKRYIGWSFRTINPEVALDEFRLKEGFFALVVDNIIGENYSDSLIAKPKAV